MRRPIGGLRRWRCRSILSASPAPTCRIRPRQFRHGESESRGEAHGLPRIAPGKYARVEGGGEVPRNPGHCFAQGQLGGCHFRGKELRFTLAVGRRSGFRIAAGELLGDAHICLAIVGDLGARPFS